MNGDVSNKHANSSLPNPVLNARLIRPGNWQARYEAVKTYTAIRLRSRFDGLRLAQTSPKSTSALS